MRTELLKYVIEVDKLHSISQASNELYISQAALSESISQFEKELNVIIFERTKKGVTTTEDGKKIIEQVKCVLYELDKLYQICTVLPAKNTYVETLTFGINEKFSHIDVLNRAISLAMQKHPALSFNAINFNSQACIDAVANRQLDFAIIGFNKETETSVLENLHNFSLQHTALPQDPIYILCNKRSALYGHHILTLEDLKNETFITYSIVSNTDIATDIEALSERVMYLPNLDCILQMIKNNIGITLLPLTLVTQAKEKIDNSLTLIPLANAFQYNYIIHPEKKKLSSAQEYFISIYEQCFKEYYT